MTTTRAEQAERTRQLILETAQKLFAEQSYDAISLQMIADTMGVAKANVYYYFHTKSEILGAITAPALTRMAAIFDAASAIANKRQRTQYVIDGYVNELLANRSLSALTSHDPAVRRERDLNFASQQIRQRAQLVLFGREPTPEQRVAFHLIDSLSLAIPLLEELSDEDARSILEQTCARVLRSLI